MLFKLSCLDCMCSQSKDVNTVRRGSGLQAGRAQLPAWLCGQRHCWCPSVYMSSCTRCARDGHPGMGGLAGIAAGAVPGSALSQSAQMGWNWVRVCPSVCRASSEGLLLTLFCCVVKSHVKAEQLHQSEGTSFSLFLHDSSVCSGWELSLKGSAWAVPSGVGGYCFL